MTDGRRVLVIPRTDPVKTFTMGSIAENAGLTVDEFRELLCRDSLPHRLTAATGPGCAGQTPKRRCRVAVSRPP